MLYIYKIKEFAVSFLFIKDKQSGGSFLHKKSDADDNVSLPELSHQVSKHHQICFLSCSCYNNNVKYTTNLNKCKQ